MNQDAVHRMGELGILGICLPVRYGGQGMDYVSLGLVCEELERVDTSLRVAMSVHVGLNSLGLFQWASDAAQLHGAYGYSDEYDVERYLRNAKGACIYEGTSQIHMLMQAEYALGYREDRPLRCELPAYDAESWQKE